ncbi:HAD-IIIC family phosphatase [Sulfitobacter sp. M368]|uniref:HAD-IIIC family phosphatase n=1 Tax=Sulfitobacter sp. M368 TaxID=2867021 RepID=UPI0021A373C4|nr:HAD-IIIC family phosphatase [Sulfitobacter sp. M368]UWR15372.1 HAD-IIIC family phosphatase [Sulfitobacter sp. M368]
MMPCPEFPEEIRLIIWDLDETFWNGTLTEGGIAYRQDCHDLVLALNRRGVMNAICSKNDHANIERLLKAKDIWDQFIFPSIDWTAKGPRIAAMLDQIGLRPQSVLFIDDNPMNLAQAAAAAPGLNTAGPEVICHLKDAPQLAGKDDPDLSRLGQYKIKEAKNHAKEITDDSSLDFLRKSDVQVLFDYDVTAHLDRAIELINRTNQLNFTKNRLPENIEDARAKLGAALSHNTSDAALIRVRDRFGDYGYVGFYLTRRIQNTRRLEHFCFSCRTLNMFIEHYVYDVLNNPELPVRGEVLSDLQNDPIKVDWITPLTLLPEKEKPAQTVQNFGPIFARGGCDLASLMHYLTLHSSQITEEFNAPRNGQMLRRDHTAFLMPALGGGLSAAEMEAAQSLGYQAQDFETDLLSICRPGSLCFLSFWADADIPVYRHKDTGLQVPYWLVGAQNHDLIARADLRAAVAKTDVQRERLNILSRYFEHLGLLGPGQMVQRYTQILDVIPPQVQIVLMLANERGSLFFLNRDKPRHRHHQILNTALRQVAEQRPNVMLLNPENHIHDAQDLLDLNHFRRDVYHRIYLELLEGLRLPKAA